LRGLSELAFPFLLQSAQLGPQGRYSFAGADPFLQFVSHGTQIEVWRGAQRQRFEADPFVALRELMHTYPMASAVETPFAAGAVGFFSYDLARVIEDLPQETQDPHPFPDIHLGFYDAVVTWDAQEGRALITSSGLPLRGRAGQEHAAQRASWLEAQLRRPRGSIPHSATPTEMTSNFSREEYVAGVEEVKRLIGAGDLFQVNLSQRFTVRPRPDGLELFERLTRVNPAPFAAYLEGPDGSQVLSASPELFVRVRGDEVLTTPIKGTRPRGDSPESDLAQAQELLNSEKDLAELVMIVDLLRNDIGRVARPGSVTVPALFDLERHPTLWQMTSTVTGSTDRSLTDVMGALFPCGSVTGAPKRRTMEIIAGLEASPRGVYCGAIGVIAPGGRARFSIAIRTVTIDRAARQAEYGVGSGIVWDSTGIGEYDECLLKTRVLTERAPAFALLESLRWAPESGYWLLEEHLGRLTDSATYFQFAIDIAEIRRRLESLAATLPPSLHKVRVLAGQRGEITVAAIRLVPETPAPVELVMAARSVDSTDVFLFHKTTRRAVYDYALAERCGGDDVLLFNERGEITETCTANVAVSRGGEWLTPPVEGGLLAGTERARLLAQGTVREAVIHLEDVLGAEALAVFNSVRLWRPARLGLASPVPATRPISPTGS